MALQSIDFLIAFIDQHSQHTAMAIDELKPKSGFQLRDITYHMKTMFLLNKSDFKTIIIPSVGAFLI